jgi:DNA-binding response OmpR family regulator
MADVPVVLLSAAGDLAERAKELGVRAYVSKPFELEELLVVVRRFV